MNKSEEELEIEEEYFVKNNRDKVFLGKAIEGKPIWDRIILDEGTPITNDTSEIGEIFYEFSSGSKMVLGSDHLHISKALVINEKTVELRLAIDGDSDIRLVISCEEPLENPLELFDTIFDVIGIPRSIQDKFELRIMGSI